MVRRWVIRGSALALLVFCVVAWVGSYFEEIYEFRVGRQYTSLLGINGGFVYLAVGPKDPSYKTSYRQWVHHPPVWGGGYSTYRSAKYRFVGMAYQSSRAPNSGWYVIVSMWIPTGLSALCFWLLWRKTRARYNGRGFPVAITEPSAKPQ